MFKPEYKLTNKIVNDLTQIAEAKAVVERAKLLPQAELRLRHQALIRMTHSSTAIEGNNLNIHQVEAVYARKKIHAPAFGVFISEPVRERFFDAIQHEDGFGKIKIE